MMPQIPVSTGLRPAQREQADFFNRVVAAFGEASRATGRLTEYCHIGREVIQIEFAGEAIYARLLPALAHRLAEPVADPSLTVLLWDSRSTAVPIPPPPWPSDTFGIRGEIPGYNSDPFRTVFHPGSNILHLFDRSRRLAVYWIDDAAEIPYWESSFPMRTILHWWTEDRPYQLVHAGAVGTPEGGVLITGKSGSGKSTTTLSCLNTALLYAGDDYVLIEVEPSPRVYSLYGTAKLEPENVERFPHLRGMISNRDQLDQQKALIYLNQHVPDVMIAGFPIRAVILPRVTGERDTRLRPATPVQALTALAPTTLFHLPDANHQSFDKMARLVRQVPCYVLEAGMDLAQIPAAILDLLAKGGHL